MTQIPPNCDIYGAQSYGGILSPIAVHGVMPWLPSDFDAPIETLVDEPINSSDPGAHDGDGTYIGSLNLSSSTNPYEVTIGFAVESWQSLLDSYEDNFYIYELESINVTLNVAGCEINDKGYYHQFRNARVYSPEGVLLGTSSSSGELSLDYHTFSFPITAVDEEQWDAYWASSHAPSGAIITIDYYHTHDAQPDNARLTAISLDVRGSYLTAYCFDGSGGIRPGPSGGDTFNSSFFKMLMVGDK